MEDRVWFTHRTKEYHADVSRKRFEWLDQSPEIRIDWDNCTLEIMGFEAGKIKFAVRSKALQKSNYMKGTVQIRYMFIIRVDPALIKEPELDRNYSLADSKRKHLPESVRHTPHDRWVIKMGEYEVWEWTERDLDIKEGSIYRLYRSIIEWLAGPRRDDKVLKVDVAGFEKITPVIYQPAVDSLDNFLREIHCDRKTDGDVADVDVSLMFNNEELRQHGLFNSIYRWFRKLLYGREIDIETFRFHFVKDVFDKDHFVFQGIYSGDADLVRDDVHGDKEPKERKVYLYFFDQKHPVVFVNTSNHALAGHDSNPELWKWEYVGWVEKPPIVMGEKSREQLDNEFKSIFRR